MRSRSLAAGTVVAAFILLSACSGSANSGSSSSSSSSSSGGGGGASSSGRVGDLPLPKLTSETQAAAQKSATAAGAPVALPAKKIGYISYGQSLDISVRVTNAVTNAAKDLHWSLQVCDGQATPAGQLTCATNFVNTGVDAILTNGMPQSSIAPALVQAKARKIPVINIGGYIGQQDLFSGSFYPSEADLGETMGKWVVDRLGSAGGPIAVQTFQADFVIQRLQGLDKAIKGTKVTVKDKFDADATNLVAGAQQAVSASFNGNSNLKAYYLTFSGSELGAAKAMGVLRPGKQYPDRPLITTFYANLPTIDLIRSGQVDAATENSSEFVAFVALDQLAEMWTRKATITSEPRPNYGTGLDFWRPFVIDKDHLPAAGKLAEPPVDFEGFFTTKWSTEFTNLK